MKHLINNPNNYTEDFSHENGNYENKCCSCKEHFLGHKRRVICKGCLNKHSETSKTKSLDPEAYKLLLEALLNNSPTSSTLPNRL